MRTLYEKLIEYDPINPVSWIQYAGLENLLADVARARAIYDLGVRQQLASPEILWKSYIDFEVGEGQRERARDLYERLAALSGHYKVWIAYGLFEGSPITIGGDEEDEDEETEPTVLPGDPAIARQVFRKGYNDLKARGEIEGVIVSFPLDLPMSALCLLSNLQRVELLRNWKEYEAANGSDADIKAVEAMMPWQVTSYGKKEGEDHHETCTENSRIFSLCHAYLFSLISQNLGFP